MADQSRGEGDAAETIIERQAAEIDDLRRRLADERFASDLRQAFQLAATSGTIAAAVSHSRLLEMIVETAARVISARAASLFLLDEQAQELIFEVAIGPKGSDVKRFRVPLGQGVAGLVAVTGQPIAVSDVQRDPRHAAGIAQSIGYLPQSILCVPLFYNDQVIGVLELLDKEGAAGFSASDMELLGLFANQAAVAIEQSRAHESVVALVGSVLDAVAGTFDDQPELHAQARDFAVSLEQDPAYGQSLEIARLVQEIAAHGDAERAACRAILAGFADYLRRRPALADGFGLAR